MPPPIMSRTRLPFAFGARACCRTGRDGGSKSSRISWPVCAAASRKMTRTSSSIDRPWRAARRRSSFLSLSSSWRTVRLAIGTSSGLSEATTVMIALQSLPSQDLESDPKQQRRDRPKRRQSPAEATGFGFVELSDSLRRQHQAIARHGVELIEHASAAGQEARGIADEAADFGHALCRAFKLAGRAEMPRHPFAHHRLRGGPHVEFWIERAPDAFHHHHGFLQQQQFRPRAHVEQAGDLEEESEQLRHRDIFGGAVVDWLADGADGLGEILHRMMRRHIAGFEMHFGDALIVAVDEAVQNLGKKQTFLDTQPAHDAAVDGDQTDAGVAEP